MKNGFVLLFLSSIACTPALADYEAIGEIQGSLCTDYIFFGSCRDVTIAAVESDGKLYEPRRRYEKVTKFDKEKATCRIDVPKPRVLSITDQLAAEFKGYRFLEWDEKSKEMKEVKIHNIKFKCRVISV